jgi:hypothetical protein
MYYLDTDTKNNIGLIKHKYGNELTLESLISTDYYKFNLGKMVLITETTRPLIAKNNLNEDVLSTLPTKITNVVSAIKIVDDDTVKDVQSTTVSEPYLESLSNSEVKINKLKLLNLKPKPAIFQIFLAFFGSILLILTSTGIAIKASNINIISKNNYTSYDTVINIFDIKPDLISDKMSNFGSLQKGFFALTTLDQKAQQQFNRIILETNNKNKIENNQYKYTNLINFKLQGKSTNEYISLQKEIYIKLDKCIFDIALSQESKCEFNQKQAQDLKSNFTAYKDLLAYYQILNQTACQISATEAEYKDSCNQNISLIILKHKVITTNNLKLLEDLIDVEKLNLEHISKLQKNHIDYQSLDKELLSI